MNDFIFRWFLAACCGFLLALPARAANPPPTQLFYVPFPEGSQLEGFQAITAGNNTTQATDPLAIFVTFSAATDNTVIYYDHWEDGYEKDITNPEQPTTLVFGDGNPGNGYPPGNPGDLIPAGTVFSLRNYVQTATSQSVLDYDARDKVASYKPISLTKTSFPAATNTLLAGCVEVFEQGLWGTEYRVPVGVDMPTSTATATLTTDADIFAYTALSIMAGAKGASVQIDADNNGAFEQTVSLGEGETVYVTGVNTGGKVVSDHPVQVVMFTGRPGSNFQSRDTTLLPTYRWSSSYYAPVSTSAANGTAVFLFNPGTSAISVSYDYRSSASAYTTATVSVPAGGNARVNLAPRNGTSHFGAYRFRTTGANPPAFYAFTAVDSTSTTTTANQGYDGGFTLVGQPSLTTQVLVSLGIGRDPYSATNPLENANPVWITTAGNGHSLATVYVDYDGDNAGPLTDPNGNQYDVSYSLRELDQQQIFDPDGDQSGMLVYSLDPSVKIAGAWAQDPTLAAVGQPGLDVSTLVPPLREGEGGKKSELSVDADGDGHISAGDTLEYDIRAINSARAAIPGPFAVKDDLPADVAYVPGSTSYRYSVGGAWQSWVSIPDDITGTVFPLDGGGFSVPGNLGTGQQLQVVFKASIKNAGELTGQSIVNRGFVEISPYGLLLPIEWEDTVYGSIGDTVWNDLDGDGVRDPGEAGISGIDVFIDHNNNQVWDADEPKATTDSGGGYLLTGLEAGTHTLRVDSADIAAANPGYGPTYDPDGFTSSHVAGVVLAPGQDRVDADFGYRVGASVGDRVWVDLNGDRIQGAGEPGLNGVRVYIDLNGNDTYDIGEPNTLTIGDGAYSIGNLDPGTYAVRVDAATLPSGAVQTHDLAGGLDHEAGVTLVAAEHRDNLDFGYRGTLSIGDFVWEDVDGNGLVITEISYNVYDGRIDLDRSGAADDGDDGFIGTIRIVNGYVDIDNDGSNSTPDNGDDGTFLGRAIVNGGVDFSGNGSIGGADDGILIYTLPLNESGIAGVRVFIDSNQNGGFDSNEPSAVTDSNGLYSIGNLPGGTYTVRVDTGTLPSGYVQTYDLTNPSTDHRAEVVLGASSRTDVDFAYRNDSSVGDLVWNDLDGDGVRDAGEPGIEGVLVYIDANGNGILNAATERYAITDIDGRYLIDNLPAGNHIVRIEISTLPQGAVPTHDLDGGQDHLASRTLALSEDAVDVDFGYRASATFGDLIWDDVNADGVPNPGESGISGVRVYVDSNGDGGFDPATEPSAITASNGTYSIGNLVPGIYTARVDTATLPVGMSQTFDATGALDHAATFFVSTNETRSDIDFGYTLPVLIGDRVWNDLDADGQQDPGEPGLGGVTVTVLHASNDTIAGVTVTDSNGAYSFASLLPGTYRVVFSKPAGFQASPANRGADASDSDADEVTGRSHDVSLIGGASALTIDAGFYQPVTIGDSVWLDANANGVQDSGETGLEGVGVTLYRPGFGPDGIPGNADDSVSVAVTTSAADGFYQFAGLAPGAYTLAFGALAGHAGTFANQGPDAADSDANPATGFTGIIVLAAGQSDPTVDAGYYLPGSISGSVWADTDDDGDGDFPLGGVLLRLLDGSGTPVLDGSGQPVTTLSLAGGGYSFPNVIPGEYCVAQDQPSDYASVSDSDGPNDNVIGNVNPIVVTGGQNNGGNDFIEIELGVISGNVLVDTDNNGSGDTSLAGVMLNLLDGFGNPVLDDLGDPVRVVTDSNGFYAFTRVPTGTYRVSQDQPSGYGSVGDVDGANNNLIGDETPMVMTPGHVASGRDFIEVLFGAISGVVFKDTDNNGTGDAVFPGVVLVLLDGAGDPVLDALGDPRSAITGIDGSYRFGELYPGDYQVSETQPAGYGSVSDADGGSPDWIGNLTPITVNPGQEVTGRDFVEIELGSISGRVLANSDPLALVTLTLLDAAGGPVDGDPDTPGVQPVTTVTDSNGAYSFVGLRPGIYQVRQTQPAGYDSVGDVDGGDPDIIGDETPIEIAPGEQSEDNDFIETLDTCPDDWNEWKFQHPGEQAAGNPDADAYDNFAEFAFAMPYDAGTGSPWLGSTAWVIQPSTLISGTLEGVFVRPKGAPLHVTYTLQYAAALGAPTVWQSIVITPAMISTADNGDCTETVTIHGLETLTGLTGGEGFVRIRADLDDDGGNNGDIDHTSFTEVEGWTVTDLEVCCRTYHNPYQRETAFTGTVTAVNGQELAFAPGDELANLSGPAGMYYLEVISGDEEGHRFDIVSTNGNTITLADDSALHSASAPFNTRTGAPPATLVGDRIAVRRHWTLGEVFPPRGFGAAGSHTAADQVQVFAGGAWTIYWLYDQNDADPQTARWVNVSDAGMADLGGTVIPPGQGLFFNNRSAQVPILAYGEVRENDFIRPHAPGSNLVGGGYPIDQSANGPGGRRMNPGTGFFGSRDFKTADSIFVWRADTTIGQTGYDSYYLLNGAPAQPSILRWVKVGDAAASVRDSEVILFGNRSVFTRTSSELPEYTVPSPWTP